MANYIENSTRTPEMVESTFKSIITPVANFIGTLRSGGTTVVDLVGDDELVYGTFTLDTINQVVKTGLLTNLPARIKFVVVSGNGRFTIEINGSK